MTIIAQKSTIEHSIEVWPVTGRKLIASGLGVPYRLWVLLWHISKTRGGGNEWLDLTPDRIAGLGRQLGIQPRSVWAALGKGDPTCWSIVKTGDRIRVRLTGQVALARAVARLAALAGLGDPLELERRKTFIACGALASLGSFYATIFAAWLATHRGNSYRATWAVLESRWGKTRPTLMNWIKWAGIRIIWNYGRVSLRPDPDNPWIAGPSPLDMPISYLVDRGEPVKVWQRGSTYVGPDTRAGRGQARRINKAIMDVSPIAQLPGSGDPNGGTTRWQRMNYQTWPGYRRARRERPDDDLYNAVDQFVIWANGKARTCVVWHYSAGRPSPM